MFRYDTFTLRNTCCKNTLSKRAKPFDGCDRRYIRLDKQQMPMIQRWVAQRTGESKDRFVVAENTPLAGGLVLVQSENEYRYPASCYPELATNPRKASTSPLYKLMCHQEKRLDASKNGCELFVRATILLITPFR